MYFTLTIILNLKFIPYFSRLSGGLNFVIFFDCVLWLVIYVGSLGYGGWFKKLIFVSYWGNLLMWFMVRNEILKGRLLPAIKTCHKLTVLWANCIFIPKRELLTSEIEIFLRNDLPLVIALFFFLFHVVTEMIQFTEPFIPKCKTTTS